MFVLGTAGHIDHGKSLLVRALTGIDPDRLREEKERGMTIDLGFAWMKLPSGREVGIVDVPGHERFIKNMLAGVGGIDLALLVVAANEGVMPQTREHLAILDLLKVRRGVVVITKRDLVDEEMLTLVKMEIEDLISGSCLEQAPVIAVSALSGEGLTELVAAIDRLLESAEPNRDTGHPRLPVDRIFTIVGAGTVVTGTLLDGTLAVGQEVEVVPPGLKSRLRGLQTHKSKVTTAQPGSRVAANLVGLTTEQLKRGDVITSPGWIKPTSLVTVRLATIGDLPRELRHGATVSFHTGAAEVMARLRLLGAEALKPGETGWAQLVLEQPVAVLGGDRFIIRSPVATLGGGEIVDVHARRLRRFRPEVLQNLERRQGDAADAVLALLEAKQPLEMDALQRMVTSAPGGAREEITALLQQGKIVGIGEGKSLLLFTASGWGKTAEKAAGILEEYHRRFPLREGMPAVELASRLKLGNAAAAALRRLLAEGRFKEEGAAIRLDGHNVRLSPAQQAKVSAFLASLEKSPYAPPADLIPEPDLLGLLVRQRKAVKVAENIVFSPAAYRAMLAGITAHIRAHGKITLAEVRDLFQTSRKYAQALLEHLDGEKITRRVGDDRVLY